MQTKKIWELDDYHGNMPSEHDLIPAIDVNGDAEENSNWTKDDYSKAVTRKLNFGQVKTQMMQMAAKWITELGRTTTESLTGWDSATQSPKEQGEIPDLAVIIKSIYGWINNNAVDIDGLLTLMEERLRGTRDDGGNNTQILINTYAKSDFLINLMKTLSGTLRSINSPVRDYIPNIPALRTYFENSYGYTFNTGVDGTWYVSGGLYPMYVKRDETGKIIKTLNVQSKPCLAYSRGAWSDLDLTQDTPQHITEVRIKGWADPDAYSNWDYSGEQWAFGRYMDTLLRTIVVPKDRNPRNLTIKEGDLTGFTVSIPKDESEARHISGLEFVQEELGAEDGIKGECEAWVTTITDEGPVAEYKDLNWVNGDFDNAFTDGIPYPNFQEVKVYARGKDEVLFVDPDYKSYTPPEGFMFLDTGIFMEAKKRDGQWNWFGYYSPEYDTEFTSDDFPNANVITAEGDVPLAFDTEPVVSDAWKPYHVDFLGDPYPINLSALLGHNNIIKCNWTRDLEGAWILESTEGRMFNSLLFADDAETIAESISYNYYDAGGMTNGGDEPNYELTVYEYLDVAVPNKTRDGGELMDEEPAEEERETVVFDVDFIADCLDGMDATAAAQLVIGVIRSLISGNGGGGETPTASAIPYDHSSSGLNATNVQGAIDELATIEAVQPRNVIVIRPDLEADIEGKAYRYFGDAQSYINRNGSGYNYCIELSAGVSDLPTVTVSGLLIKGNNTSINTTSTIEGSDVTVEDCSFSASYSILSTANNMTVRNCTFSGALTVYATSRFSNCIINGQVLVYEAATDTVFHSCIQSGSDPSWTTYAAGTTLEQCTVQGTFYSYASSFIYISNSNMRSGINTNNSTAYITGCKFSSINGNNITLKDSTQISYVSINLYGGSVDNCTLLGSCTVRNPDIIISNSRLSNLTLERESTIINCQLTGNVSTTYNASGTIIKDCVAVGQSSWDLRGKINITNCICPDNTLYFSSSSGSSTIQNSTMKALSTSVTISVDGCTIQDTVDFNSGSAYSTLTNCTTLTGGVALREDPQPDVWNFYSKVAIKNCSCPNKTFHFYNGSGDSLVQDSVIDRLYSSEARLDLVSCTVSHLHLSVSDHSLVSTVTNCTSTANLTEWEFWAKVYVTGCYTPSGSISFYSYSEGSTYRNSTCRSVFFDVNGCCLDGGRVLASITSRTADFTIRNYTDYSGDLSIAMWDRQNNSMTFDNCHLTCSLGGSNSSGHETVTTIQTITVNGGSVELTDNFPQYVYALQEVNTVTLNDRATLSIVYPMGTVSGDSFSQLYATDSTTGQDVELHGVDGTWITTADNRISRHLYSTAADISSITSSNVSTNPLGATFVGILVYNSIPGASVDLANQYVWMPYTTTTVV